jgi:hypothetical protein
MCFFRGFSGFYRVLGFFEILLDFFRVLSFFEFVSGYFRVRILGGGGQVHP